jgi:hypothetical protein
MFDQPLLLGRETLKLKTAFQKSLIPNYGLQLQSATKVRQIENQIHRVAGMYFSSEHDSQATFAQGERAPWD